MDLGSSNIPVTEIYQQRLNGALLVFNEFWNPDLIFFIRAKDCNPVLIS